MYKYPLYFLLTTTLLLNACDLTDDTTTIAEKPKPKTTHSEPIKRKDPRIFSANEFVLGINQNLHIYINSADWKPNLNTSPHIHLFVGQIPINFKPVKPENKSNDIKFYQNTDEKYSTSSMEFIVSLKNTQINDDYQISFYDKNPNYSDDLVYVRITDISDLTPNGHNEIALMSPQERYNDITSKIEVNYKFNQYGMECSNTMHYDFCLGTNPHTDEQIYLYTNQNINRKDVDIEAFYNSNKYGRLRIEWRITGTSIKDWQVIDSKIWEILKTLNVGE